MMKFSWFMTYKIGLFLIVIGFFVPVVLFISLSEQYNSNKNLIGNISHMELVVKWGEVNFDFSQAIKTFPEVWDEVEQSLYHKKNGWSLIEVEGILKEKVIKH